MNGYSDSQIKAAAIGIKARKNGAYIVKSL